MNKRHTSLESYFQSAKNYKSPVSKDNARSLIENDGKKYYSTKFKLKKGVLAMTIIASLMTAAIIGSISLGIFDETEYTAVNTTKKNNISIADKQVDELNKPQKVTITKKENPATATNTVGIVRKEETNIIKGLNRINLSKEELETLGIFIVEIKENERNLFGVKYSNRFGEKSIEENIFTLDNGSRHKMSNSDDCEKCIKILPTIITDFSGAKRLYQAISFDNNIELDEYMPFHKNLRKLYSLYFPNGKAPVEIPSDIKNALNDLRGLISIYTLDRMEGKYNSEIADAINKNLIILIEYYTPFTKNSPKISQEDNFEYSQVMEIYPEDPDSPEIKKHIEQMAKMGIKVIAEKQPVQFKNHLKEIKPDIEVKLTELNTEIENYLMINEMIALEIPVNNGDENSGFIFWYKPSKDLLKYLPEKISSQLKKEMEYLDDTHAICGAPIKKKDAVLDIWRSCSGAIENLRVFPNPVKDNLNIRFELLDNRNITFSLHDIDGKKVTDLNNSETFRTGKNNTRFNISKMNKGMYLLVATSETGEQAVQRLIKE